MKEAGSPRQTGQTESASYRFPGRRHTFRAGIAISGILLAAVPLLFFQYFRPYVRMRMERHLSEMGVEAVIDAVRIDLLGEIHLSNVQVRDPIGGLVLTVEDVILHIPRWRTLATASVESAVTQATMRGVRFSTDDEMIHGTIAAVRVGDGENGSVSLFSGITVIEPRIHIDPAFFQVPQYGDRMLSALEPLIEPRFEHRAGPPALRHRLPRIPRIDVQNGWLRISPSVLSAQPFSFSFRADRAAGTIEGTVGTDSIELNLLMVAPGPIVFPEVGYSFRARYHERRVDYGELTLAGHAIDFRPAFETRGSSTQLELRLEVPETPVQTLIERVPEVLLGELADMQLDGTLAWTLEFVVPLDRPSAMDWNSRVDLDGFSIRSMPRGMDVRRIAGAFSHTIVDPQVPYRRTVQIPEMQLIPETWLQDVAGLTDHQVQIVQRRRRWIVHSEPEAGMPPQISHDNDRDFVRLPEVSPWVIRAVLSGEDNRFFLHSGFEWGAIKRAVELNVNERRFVVGASTISMQLAKNLYLDHSRTIGRKIQEAFLVYLMEHHLELPKERILELYLNIVEFGPGVFGISHAARYYFDKAPAQLNVTESVWLASILPSPKSFHRQFLRGEVTEHWMHLKEQYLATMVRRDRMTDEEYRAAVEERPQFIEAQRES